MHPFTAGLVGVTVGVVVTLGLQTLIAWSAAASLDDAGWTREGDD